MEPESPALPTQGSFVFMLATDGTGRYVPAATQDWVSSHFPFGMTTPPNPGSTQHQVPATAIIRARIMLHPQTRHPE